MTTSHIFKIPPNIPPAKNEILVWNKDGIMMVMYDDGSIGNYPTFDELKRIYKKIKQSEETNKMYCNVIANQANKIKDLEQKNNTQARIINGYLHRLRESEHKLENLENLEDLERDNRRLKKSLKKLFDKIAER